MTTDPVVTQADYLTAQCAFDDVLGYSASYAEFGRPSYREGAVRTLADALARHRTAAEKSGDVALRALVAVIDAVRDYLPPDGISMSEAMDRIIGAVDNPEINPVITPAEQRLAALTPADTDEGEGA